MNDRSQPGRHRTTGRKREVTRRTEEQCRPRRARGLSLAMLLLALTANSQAMDWVVFDSAADVPEKIQSLRGAFYLPPGSGPFPAVVIAHGCFGVENHHHSWARRLNEWGYAAIVVDSFTSRKVETVCAKPALVSPRERAFDVYGAVAFLRLQASIDAQNIAMIGFSHGGWTALFVGQEYFPELAGVAPIQAVVSYYPWCDKRKLKTTGVPLLILSGNLDDWTPVSRCYRYIEAQKKGYRDNVALKIYENAHHGFDDTDLDNGREYDGYTLKYNAKAAELSIKDTRAFLARFLK